jgi:ferric iron reductase protein FhuF
LKEFLKEHCMEVFGTIVGFGLIVYSAINKNIIWFNFGILIMYMHLNNFKTDLNNKKIKDLEERLLSTEDSLNTLSNAILKIIKEATDKRH